ncbi:MAG: alpha-hydroxy acid oxidase [Caldicoprobacterales bacterium]|jgi:4-hydroxymandelate oxidase|nr:alpha-hydroxy-acid oxidizing protein [Clostridiales bacterium]
MGKNDVAKRIGDSNQITRDYIDSILVEVRHIDNKKPKTDFELYGHSFKTPIMTAALSHLDNYAENGAVNMAKGAYMADAVYWTGMGDMDELERIVETGAKTIKIIKPYKDNDDIFRKIEHAEKVGAIAVGIDVDHSFNSKGEYDVVLGDEMRPKTMEELRSFAESTKLPFIIKGVLSVSDALKCVEFGARGIVISHHNGVIDYAVPTYMILQDIVKEVGGKIPIFIDCGIKSGMDTFKALALGATAVCVGKWLMGPLQENGAEGVKDEIIKMTQELAGVMARTGFETIDEIEPSILRIPR